MRTTIPILLCFELSLVFATAGGCGDDGEDPDAGDAGAQDAGGDRDGGEDAGDAGPPDSSEGLALEALCDEIASFHSGAFCAADPDPERCEASDRRMVDGCEGLVRAVEQGRLTYDGIAAQACSNRNSGMAMSPSDLLLACPEVFGGRIEEGEPCYDGYAFGASECAPSLYCEAFLTCPSTCLAYVQEGEPCEGLRCAEGLVCVELAGSWQCLTLRADGDDCEAPQQCQNFTCVAGKCVTPQRECESPDGCGDGRVCLENEDRSTMCAAAAEGDPCPVLGCEPDHYCRDEGGESGVCRPDGELGGVCDAPADLLDMNTPCVDGLHCMVSSTGTCLPPGSLDEPCDTRTGASCEEGLACAPSMGSTCQLPSALGAPCSAWFGTAACAEGYCACSDEDPMSGDLPCDQGQCAPLLELDEPCTSHEQCESEFCEIFASEPVCAVPLALREPCVVPPE